MTTRRPGRRRRHRPSRGAGFVLALALGLLLPLGALGDAEQAAPASAVELGESPILSAGPLQYRPGRGLRIGSTGAVIGGFTNLKGEYTKDSGGEWLDGGSTYRLTVPAKVPARDLWSVVAYDVDSAAWILEQPRVGIDSTGKDLQINEDGSVDVYFSPRAPDGKE